MVNRSGLIQMEITKDSIKTGKLSSDFTPKERPGEAHSYIKKISLEDRILLISKSPKDTSKYFVMTLINFADKKYFENAWNGLDTLTDDLDLIIRLNKNDKRPLYGYYAFSEHYIDSLKLMKPIENMTLDEFKKYLTIYLNKMKMTKVAFEKSNHGYLGGVTYSFQLISQALFDTGFNPIQNVRTIEPVMKKYYEDPGVKKLIEEAGQK